MSGATDDERTTNGRGTQMPAVKIISKGQLLAIKGALNPKAHADPLTIPNFGPSGGFYVSVQLRPLERAEIWRNGRHAGTARAPVGGVNFFDMRERWRALVYGAFHSVTFSVPAVVLEADEDALTTASLPAIDVARVDPTLRHLALALTPAFARPSEMSQLFAEHLLETVRQHLRHVYGRGPILAQRPHGGLAPWQGRRISERLRAALDGEISNAELAAECGLSPGHFAKAFRQSFGLPPHRWLMRERVRRAMELMEGTTLPIDQIALACGFFDQAHLTRVFRAMIGHTPAAWRRDRGHNGAADGGAQSAR